MTSKRMVFGRYDYAAFLGFATYAGCSVAVPVVLVELAESLHFPLNSGGQGAGGALQLARSLTMVATMLACGFLAGRWGKRITVALALMVMGGGLILCSLAPFYGVLFVALGIAGLGEGVIEGLATPVVQDLHADDEPGRYINFAHSFWSVGVVAAVLAAGFALQYGVSWRIILAVIGLLPLIPAVMFLMPSRSQRFPPSEKADHRTVWLETGKILTAPRFWLFFAAMFLAGGGEYCLTFWAAAFIRLEYGGSAIMGGIGTAIFSAGMIISRMCSGLLVPQHRLPHLVIGAAVLGTLFGVLPAVLHSTLLFFIVLFVLGLASGPFWPSIQSYCVDRLQLDSTMIFVLLSCAGVPGCGFFTWLMGATADHISMRWSSLLVPGCYLLVGLLIFIDHLQAGRPALSQPVTTASRRP